MLIMDSSNPVLVESHTIYPEQNMRMINCFSPFSVQKAHKAKKRPGIEGIFFLLIAIFSLFQPAGQLKSQSLESGTPWFSHIYPPAEYQGHSQNWAVDQLPSGEIVFGNTNGLLIYDGYKWKHSRYNQQIRALASGKTNKLYYGGKNDFGFFTFGSDSLQHKSLIDELSPADSVALGTVWHVFTKSDAVYYLGTNIIVKRRANKNIIIRTTERIHTAFSVNDNIYVKLRGGALYKLANNNLVLIPGTEVLSDSRVSSMLRRPDNKILISTPNERSYLLSDTSLSTFSTSLNDKYQSERLYNSCQITDTTSAMLTMDNGVYIIDQDGLELAHYEAPNLLSDATSHSCMVDRSGQLWIAHNYGISRIDLSIDLTFYGSFLKKSSGYNLDELHGKISSIDYFNNTLFVGTQSGLYQLDPENGFKKLFQINSAVKDLEVVAGKLWIGTINGLYAYDKAGKTEAIAAGIAHTVHDLLLVTDNAGDSTLFVSGKNSLIQINPYFDATANPASATGFESNAILHTTFGNGDYTNLLITDNNIVWGVLNNDTIFALIANTDSTRQLNIQQFNLENNDLRNISLHISGDTLIVASDQQRYQIQIGDQLANGIELSPIPGLKSGSVYKQENNIHNSWRTLDGQVQFSLNNKPWQIFGPLADQNIDVQFIYPEQDGTTWFAAGLTLFRYSPTNYQPGINTLVITEAHQLLANQRLSKKLNLNAKSFTILEQDTLHFSWRLFDYQNDTEVKFRYQIADQIWSEWSLNQEVSLERLASQAYTFQVEAQTPRGKFASQKINFIVKNTPVWYRSSWLDVLYILAGMASIIFIFVYLLSRTAKKRNLKLMAEIESLRQEKERARLLEEANAKLMEANRIRDEFVAITSHEIRTPLTSIIGFAGILQDEGSELQQEFAGAILNSSERLLKMLNDLLELAGLKAKGISPDSAPVNVYQEANRVVQLVQDNADQKGLNLVLLAPAGLACFVDGFCLSRILENLVVNAVKFTDQGLVAINISESDGKLNLAVSDTGRGISEDFMPDIYKPFRQESNGVQRSHEGSGLGLAITRLVTELAGGTISIKSVLGKGTTVFVELPLLNATQSKIIETNARKIELSLG